MFKTTKSQTRTDNTVDFWEAQGTDPTVKPYIKENYLDTGKIIQAETILSEDGQTLSRVVYWESEAAHQEFLDDPIIQEKLITPGHTYMDDGGIDRTTATEEVTDFV